MKIKSAINYLEKVRWVYYDDDYCYCSVGWMGAYSEVRMHGFTNLHRIPWPWGEGIGASIPFAPASASAFHEATLATYLLLLITQSYLIIFHFKFSHKHFFCLISFHIFLLYYSNVNVFLADWWNRKSLNSLVIKCVTTTSIYRNLTV